MIGIPCFTSALFIFEAQIQCGVWTLSHFNQAVGSHWLPIVYSRTGTTSSLSDFQKYFSWISYQPLARQIAENSISVSSLIGTVRASRCHITQERHLCVHVDSNFQWPQGLQSGSKPGQAGAPQSCMNQKGGKLYKTEPRKPTLLETMPTLKCTARRHRLKGESQLPKSSISCDRSVWKTQRVRLIAAPTDHIGRKLTAGNSFFFFIASRMPTF